ncbi:hypothetical protein HDU91_002667, partial [Kappamyces sp. JEL0680]
MPELQVLDEVGDKETFVVSKFTSLGQSSDVDEKSLDAKYRAAARSWRQLFRMPENERFVNCKEPALTPDYSCSYHRTLLNQGWLYISMSYCCFYSSVLGTETKVVIEFKQVVELSKEKSKSGLVSDTIRIVMKNKTVHQFSNLFMRDETFEVLEYLVQQSMSRLLKSTATDPAPGQSFAQEQTNSEQHISPAAILGLAQGHENLPLKQAFDLQKKNNAFQQLFSLVATETITQELSAVCSVSGTSNSHPGTLYLSPTYLCFISTQKYQCQLTLPFFAIMRVERINAQTSTIAITARHGFKLLFQLNTDKPAADRFCLALRDRLQEHVESMKKLKPFLQTCSSEDLLSGRDTSISGLGATFGYIDSKKAVEKNKLRYWVSYFKEYGRNLTLVRLPTFIKLVRVGLPNTLRGEIWEVMSGSIFKRFANPGYYQKLHDDHVGFKSLSIEEIEKDLNRSLPEYPGYQTPEGINSLRRVLYEEAFWLLTVLTERMLPGYYTVNMVGAVIDNHVFDKLVKQLMPILGDHLAKHEIQLSVACLPWFLTLFINSLPLSFALRVLDCFFMEGVKFLFQIGLAILKVNGDEILAVQDDGELMNVLKSYFLKLGDIEILEAGTKASRQTTKFNQLMLTAYREFQNVTLDLIVSLRKSMQLEVIQSMDLYAKRSMIRSLKHTYKFTKDELLFLADVFYTIQYYRAQRKSQDSINEADFKVLISNMCHWAVDTIDNDDSRSFPTNSKPGNHFLHLLFTQIFDTNEDGWINFADILKGLTQLIHTAGFLQLFFNLHDSDKDGRLSKEDTILLSETFLFLFRKLEGDAPLGAVSSFLNRAFMVPIKEPEGDAKIN